MNLLYINFLYLCIDSQSISNFAKYGFSSNKTLLSLFIFHFHKTDHPQVPKMLGKISNLEKFDATFFGIHSKQADVMDPQSRLLLEHTYEAIIDAGVNPKNLRGTKTGVFIGATYSESEKTWLYEEQDSGFGLAGVSRAMFCNRISHWLDLTGPSFTIDAACSSSLTAVEQAYRSIKDGYCEAAIVGGSTICLQPYMSMQSFKLGQFSINVMTIINFIIYSI